jgi:hypothetical protein
MNHYWVLLPALLISILGLLYLLKKKPAIYKRLFFYLNILLIIYCLLDVVFLLNRSFSNTKTRESTISFDYKKVSARPNVYYLLFDEYPGYQSLLSETGFKNDSLYHFLQDKGFTILPTFSNYNFTLFSMSSIFNMQYVADDYNHEHQRANKEDLQKRFIEIKDAQVFSIFRQMGYCIENYSLFDIGSQVCINPEKTFLPVHRRALTAKMLHNRFRKDVGWQFRETWLESILTDNGIMYPADDINNNIISKLNNSIAGKNGKPKFCYAHFILPHAPYFRDSAGALITVEKISSLNDTRYFLPYLKYTNKVISLLVNKIVQQDASAVIVIMSDHGFRDFKHHHELYQPAFDNICAVRFPGNHLLPYKAQWSSVNFFPYLFNNGFGQQIRYLKDSAIWINY